MDGAEIDDYLQKTDYGFIINLKSNSNVPSPAISNGKIHVSGGFGSKKYFAFDAFTGEKIWAKLLDDDGPSSAAIVVGISVFNTESCTIFACDENTEKILLVLEYWSFWLIVKLINRPINISDKIEISIGLFIWSHQSVKKLLSLLILSCIIFI